MTTKYSYRVREMFGDKPSTIEEVFNEAGKDGYQFTHVHVGNHFKNSLAIFEKEESDDDGTCSTDG